MDAFVWNERFETGIEIVDGQHQKLVETTNALGELLLKGQGISDAELQSTFHQLAEYGRHHFDDEEKMMQALGVDPRHLDLHRAHHRQFFEQLVGMWRSRSSMARPAETIHGFLTAWLTMHILGEDKEMAAQIRRIRQGEPAADAYLSEHLPADSSTAILLDALGRLYGLLAEQNVTLAEANLGLEARVESRTRALTDSLKKVEETQQQLLQSEKMAAVGQLAAGVAHEINNPIGFVNSNLGTLKTYIANLLKLVDRYESLGIQGEPAQIELIRKAVDIDFLREDLPSLLQESQEGLDRVTRIVQDLKDFSHVEQSGFQLSDLNAAMESTLNVVSNELKYKAEVNRQLGAMPLVDCIPAQINQVFMNLLLNAAQAIEKSGTITIRSGVENQHAWFEIEDSGKGIPEDLRHRIFEPFFTTKPVGQGTGLGLSISYDIIVKRHGGRIEVRSEMGVGSCFRISLPLSQRRAA